MSSSLPLYSESIAKEGEKARTIHVGVGLPIDGNDGPFLTLSRAESAREFHTSGQAFLLDILAYYLSIP
jgi:hypothetical protein